ncbi:MerR family transcriptional regulator [Lactiplantibacillus paraxiangfangensis]|uniref:MerR family transcriptional regulator n=1 Tax=Lactiplantibacillus paraxiangfangensis TaxID=3076224 RepID=UPI0030C7630C
MKINEVATYFGLQADTLRYWEKIGIISKITRDTSGYRDYNQDDLDWIRYVKCIREIGVPITTIQKYTTTSRLGQDPTLAQNMLVKQRNQLQQQINEIKHAIELADHKIENYDKLLAEKHNNKRVNK